MLSKRYACVAVLLLIVSCDTVQSQSVPLPEFKQITLEERIGKVCYAVTVADVNNDGKPDPVALSENRLIWYENPSWTPHVIIDDQLDADHVCIAPYDIDGDGWTDFAIGAGWTKKGTINWVSRDPENPDGLWKTYHIATEPWTHRMRWTKVGKDEKPVLTVSPLNKTHGDGVRLLALEIPQNPRTQRWPMTVLDHSLNRVHNHFCYSFELFGNQVSGLLTASQEGFYVFGLDDVAGEITSVEKKLATIGTSGDQPNGQGVGEIKMGSLPIPGTDHHKLAWVTIEPMHGNRVVVYRDAKNLEPIVIDDTLGRGHALWLANLDQPSSDDRPPAGIADEIIVGHSQPATGDIKGPGIYIYRWNAKSGDIHKWDKHVLDDGGIATEDLIAHDFNGDGWVDILAGGRDTHNVKLYLNQGTAVD